MRTESGLCVITNLKPTLLSVGFCYFCLMKKILYPLFFFLTSFVQAQDTLIPMIFLNDVVISEENTGFSVQDFVGYVKNDTTFYMGFKHMRYYSHEYESNLNIFDKKGKKIGSIRKFGVHHSNGNQAWIVNDSIISEGNIFKKNGDYKYYTPEAFDEVFFPKDTISVSLNISRDKNYNESQNMRDAKTVGFSIGTEDVEQSKGGISKRLAIFDVDMQKYYDYIIGETTYKNKDCYTFSIKVKNNLSSRDMKKVLIRDIVSYFDKSNFNVIYREYKFVYKNWFLALDMDIKVEMDYINAKHVPIEIHYNGFWDVIFFKPERADFLLRNTSYNMN